MSEPRKNIPPYSLRQATLADRPRILPLLIGLAPERDQAKHVRWLYDENPEGPAVTWVAEDDASGEIAGVTSYFPWRLFVQGRVVRAAIGGDGFVSPKFRRRGIAAALHGALRAEMSRLGFTVMFGAPAAMNRTPLQASGSVRISEHVRFIRPLSASALSPRLAVLDPLARWLFAPGGSDVRLDPAVASDKRIDAVWEATRRELQISTVRDARFYDWRFRASPSGVQRPYVALRGSEPIGVCALEEHGAQLRIIDVCAPSANWGAMLRAIASTASGMRSIQLWMLREDAATRPLVRHGFVARDAVDFLVVTPADSQNTAVLHDGKRWIYLEGDIDIDRGV